VTEWKKEVLKLDENHTWRAKPGYRIFVADEGAIRFDVPESWIFVAGEDSFKFHDRQPPDDDCTLEVSLLRHSRIDWTGLPLPQLIGQVITHESGDAIKPEEVRLISRPDVEMAWTEIAFTDRQQRRPARSRICVARGAHLHALFTFSFWLDDFTALDPVWGDVLNSLELGIIVKDPRHGPVRM
jgi:hypothetical protein